LVGDPVYDRVILIKGSIAAPGREVVLDEATVLGRTLFQAENIGARVGAAGDLDGDGYADLFIGVDDATPYIALFRGQPLLGRVVDLKLQATTYITGVTSSAQATGVGDMNGDGYGDFVVADGGRFIASPAHPIWRICTAQRLYWRK